jgi:drug/metabolite transporter (DMT)-like permease
MVLATMLWGATFVVIRDILHGLRPTELIAARFALATVALAIVQAIRRRPIDRTAVVAGGLCGLCAAAAFSFQAIGLTSTSAGSSAFLTCAGTVFAALFAWPMLGERPSSALLQGIAAALVGSALLAERLGILAAGDAWTLLGALVFAMQIVIVGRYADRVDPLVLVGIQSLVVAVLLAPFAGGALPRLAALPPDGLARLGYLALAGSVVAPLLQVVAQRDLPAGRVALLFALEPVFALLFALAFAGERFGPRWWIGAALILAGVLRVEWRAAPTTPSAATR